jgi:hypothetical protein
MMEKTDCGKKLGGKHDPENGLPAVGHLLRSIHLEHRSTPGALHTLSSVTGRENIAWFNTTFDERFHAVPESKPVWKY